MATMAEAETEPDASLGVSALLDELLAERVGICSPKNFAPPERTVANEQDEAEQLAELCGEMDSCLASLENWEKRREMERDALKRELEAQYGFSYEEAVAAGSETCPWEPESPHEHDHVDSDGAEDSVAIPQAKSSTKQRARTTSSELAGLPGPPICKIEQLIEDDARLAKLRAEVEALRRKDNAGYGLADAQADCEVVRATREGDVSSMTAWCMEVDAVLEHPSLIGDLDSSHEASLLGHLEAQLDHARVQADTIQGSIGNARSRIDEELRDLDTMLADCDAVQAKMKIK